MMKKTLTVFTPTYNRAHTLPRTYESLCRQTCHDFEWLVVDDGSTDGTDALAAQWMSEGRIAMRYIRQENQGMHGAHNTAYAHISSPLNVCIDSDDMLTDKAVEIILRTWREQADEHTAGLVGLDVDMATRQVIGTPFPEGVNRLHMTDYYNRMKGRGDKKYVLRTDLVKKYPPYPLFCGEKYVNLATLYAFIDIDYTWIVLNEPLAVVDYQVDGSSYSMYRQYWNNPRGFMYHRVADMQHPRIPLRRKLMAHVHYVSSALRAREWKFVQRSPMPLVTLLAFIPGVMLYIYIWSKVRRGALMHVDHNQHTPHGEHNPSAS